MNRDFISVEQSLRVLSALGCPTVRRGERSPEWEASKGAYRFTPDLIAGPLVGGGDPSDFYIDVFAPSGDQFVKPKAGNLPAAIAVLRAIVERGSINLDEIGDTGEQLIKPMKEKLDKYAAKRGNTPMFGLSMYFKMTGTQYMGPVLAGCRAPTILDGAFGITKHLGAGAMHHVMRCLMAPGMASVILSLPIAQPLSLVLCIFEKAQGPNAVLMVNHGVRKTDHPYVEHPVIQWLRDTIRPETSKRRPREGGP